MSAEPAKLNGHPVLEQFTAAADNGRRTTLCCARLPGPGSGWCLREDGHDGEHAGIASAPYDSANSVLNSTKGMRKK